MRLTGIILVLAGVPLIGCTLAGGHLRDLDPEPGTLSPSIEETVDVFSFGAGPLVSSERIGREINYEILSRWKKSGLIADYEYVEASRFSGSADFRLTLSGYRKGEGNAFLVFLSGLTLGVIPNSVNST